VACPGGCRSAPPSRTSGQISQPGTVAPERPRRRQPVPGCALSPTRIELVTTRAASGGPRRGDDIEGLRQPGADGAATLARIQQVRDPAQANREEDDERPPGQSGVSRHKTACGTARDRHPAEAAASSQARPRTEVPERVCSEGHSRFTGAPGHRRAAGSAGPVPLRSRVGDDGDPERSGLGEDVERETDINRVYRDGMFARTM
jgi:hypothetical protein